MSDPDQLSKALARGDRDAVRKLVGELPTDALMSHVRSLPAQAVHALVAILPSAACEALSTAELIELLRCALPGGYIWQKDALHRESPSRPAEVLLARLDEDLGFPDGGLLSLLSDQRPPYLELTAPGAPSLRVDVDERTDRLRFQRQLGG